MTNPVLAFGITGKDTQALREFYSEVLAWRIGDGDPHTGSDCRLIEPGYGGPPGGVSSRPPRGRGQTPLLFEAAAPAAPPGRDGTVGGEEVVPETAARW